MTPVDETQDLLDDLIRAGAASHIVKRVAKLLAAEEALNERRSKDAARKAEKRSEEKASPQMSEDVRGHVGQARMSASRGGARAEPETTNSSEDQKKESKEESKNSPSARRAGVKTLFPDDFAPSDATFAKAAERGQGRTVVVEKAEALREWSRGKGEKRADWDAVLQSALRKDAAGPRPGTGPPDRAGNGTGFNGKVTLGDIHNAAKAAIAARDANNGRPRLELLAGPDRRAGNGDGDHRPADGVPRSADRPGDDRGDLLRGLLRARSFPD